LAQYPQSPRIGQAFLSNDYGTQQLWVWSGYQWVLGNVAGSIIGVEPNTGLGLTAGILSTTYNTILDPDITMPYSVGGINAGTTVSELTGETFVQLFDDLLFPKQLPTYTIPTISLNGAQSTTAEVGSTLSLNLLTSSVKNDAGAYTQMRILRNSSPLQTYTSLTASEATAIPDQFGYPDPNNPNLNFNISSAYAESYIIPAPGGGTSTITTYNSDGNYNSGLAKNKNNGDIDPRTPELRSVNAPQSAGTNFSSTTYTYTGIYPYFWGVSTSQPTAAIIAAAITEGTTTTKVLSSASGTITITFGNATPKYLWFAHFSNYTSKTKWYIDALNSGTIGGSTNLFGSPIVTGITGPNGYWNGINFNIYITNYQTKPPSAMELRNI
jgi:hypothetical protein